MSKQRNLNDGDLPKILSRLDRLERQASLAHSAIGREGLEVYDGGWIRILNGGLQVIGTATISGTLDVTGVTNLKGQTSVTGPMEISGTTNITGNTNIMGELNVTGPTTLDGITEIGGDTTVSGNFEITTGGKFKAGSVEINPDGSAKFGQTTIDTDGVVKTGQMELRPDAGGQLAFNGGALTSDSFGVLLNSINPVRLQGASVEVNSPSFAVLALPAAPSGSTANIYVDPSGRFHRIT